MRSAKAGQAYFMTHKYVFAKGITLMSNQIGDCGFTSIDYCTVTK